MPPGQPIYRCQGCGSLRPCRPFSGDWFTLWLGTDCAPINVLDAPAVATDGGHQ